jgi:hypothetical protein
VSDKEVTEFDIPFPGMGGLHLIVEINGCNLKIAPDGSRWVVGSSTYGRPPGPEVVEDGSELTVRQEYLRSELTNMMRVAGDSPLVDLHLGADEPYHMTLDSSGDESELDLGGLPLRSLRISDKLGGNFVDFSVPHPSAMDSLEVDLQGSNVRFINLANANFKNMSVTGRAGTCRLGFGGVLQQDCSVALEVSETPTTLFIPAETAAIIQAQDGSELEAANIELGVDDGFTLQDGSFCTKAALDGVTPVLTVRVKPLGPLTLKTLVI